MDYASVRGEEAAALDKLTIPGDPRLEETIRHGAAHLPGQAFLLSGAGDRLAAGLFLAAAIQCRGEDRPCGRCGPCRKILAGIHPDVTVVRDPDHKNLSMEVLRQVRQDAYILPNEGEAKIYLFPDCGLLEAKTQNVLLKVLEEGPAHAVFLFCAESAAQLLPTVRSRCVEWKVRGAEETGEADPRAAELCRLLEAGSVPALAAFFAGLETGKVKREELQGVLEDARRLLTAALLYRSGCGGSPGPGAGLSRRQLSRGTDILKTAAEQLRFNLNPGHVCGGVCAQLARCIRP